MRVDDADEKQMKSAYDLEQERLKKKVDELDKEILHYTFTILLSALTAMAITLIATTK